MRINCLQRTFSAPAVPLIFVQPPSPNEIHLWYILPSEVKSITLLDQYYQHVSPCEKDNISSMGTEQLRRRALLAHTLVRTTIARYQINSQITPSSLKFIKNIHGKPEVDWQRDDKWSQPPLHFNLSHTSSLIVCGVTSNSPIGIDVEEKQRRMTHNTLAFAHRYYTPQEVEYLSAISDSEVQKRELLKIWTIKVSEIAVKSVDNLDPSLTSNWHFKLLELAGTHYAAICTERNALEGKTPPPPRKLTVWKTIPLVEDECVSGTSAVREIS